MPRYKLEPKSEAISVGGLEFRGDHEGCFELPDNPVILDQLRDAGYRLAATDAMDGQSSTIRQAEMITERDGQIQALTSELDLCRQRVAERDREVEPLHKKIEELEQQGPEYERQILDLTVKLAERDNQLAVQTKNRADADSRAETAETALATAETHGEATSATLVEKTEELAQTKEQLEELQTRPAATTKKK
jgi:chromosome segregation ATPase